MYVHVGTNTHFFIFIIIYMMISLSPSKQAPTNPKAVTVRRAHPGRLRGGSCYFHIHTYTCAYIYTYICTSGCLCPFNSSTRFQTGTYQPHGRNGPEGPSRTFKGRVMLCSEGTTPSLPRRVRVIKVSPIRHHKIDLMPEVSCLVCIYLYVQSRSAVRLQ